MNLHNICNSQLSNAYGKLLNIFAANKALEIVPCFKLLLDLSKVRWLVRPIDDMRLLSNILIKSRFFHHVLFVEIQDQFIGHLIPSYLFFKLNDMNSIDNVKRIVLVGASSKSSNQFLANQIQTRKRRLLKPGRILRKLLINSHLDSLHAYHDCNKNDFITYHYLKTNSMLLKRLQTSLLREIDRKVLINHIPWYQTTKKICVVHTRCNKYNAKTATFANNHDYEQTRNYDIQKLESSIRYLLDKGYFVIRSGIFVEKRLQINCTDYIELADYPTSLSEYLTILAFLSAKLVITTGSGVDALCALNPDVTLGVLFQPHSLTSPYSIRQLFFPPLFYKDEILLTPDQYLALDPIFSQEDLVKQGLSIYKPHDKVEEFIKELVEFSERDHILFNKASYHHPIYADPLYNILAAKNNNMVNSPNWCLSNVYLNIFEKL